MKKLLIFFLLLTALAFSQNDPDKILEKVTENFNKIKDYSADIKIKIDVDFLKAPVSEAKIYFKQPDKVQIKSETFAMLPKEGLDFSPSALLKNDYTAIYEKEEVVDGFNTSVIKVIPLGDGNEIILTTLWVDREKELIRRIKSTTRMNGSFTIDLDYNDEFKYPLPEKMVFSFEVDKMNLPRGINGDIHSKSESKEMKKSADEVEKKSVGKVYINYSNYEINKGIPEKVFEKR